jgi:hypothetical protein
MNTGVFVLGFVLAIVGFISDITNYHDTYAMWFIIAGLILIVIGAIIPSVVTSTTHREVAVPAERRVKTTVRED